MKRRILITTLSIISFLTLSSCVDRRHELYDGIFYAYIDDTHYYAELKHISYELYMNSSGVDVTEDMQHHTYDWDYYINDKRFNLIGALKDKVFNKQEPRFYKIYFYITENEYQSSEKIKDFHFYNLKDYIPRVKSQPTSYWDDHNNGFGISDNYISIIYETKSLILNRIG